MNPINIPHIFEFQDVLNQKYKELKKDYVIAKNKADLIFRRNLENPLHNHKLLHHIDISVLDTANSNFFKQYEVDIESRIERMLQKKYLLDQDTLINLFEIRKEMMDFNINEITIENIGSILNDLREFMEDIEVDIERNRIFKINDKEDWDSTSTEINYVDLYRKNLKDTKIKENNDWKVIYD